MSRAMTNPTDQALVETPEYPMPRAAGCPFDPPPALRALQAQAPITRVRLWDGSIPVAGHPVRRPARPAGRSADQLRHHGSRLPAPQRGRAGTSTQARTFINMDDPEHARLRRMVTATFAIKRVEAMRPAVQRIVDDLIDRMLAGPHPVDLVRGLRAAGALAGDLRTARRALRRPRLLPAQQQAPDQPGHPAGGEPAGPGQLHRLPGPADQRQARPPRRRPALPAGPRAGRAPGS